MLGRMDWLWVNALFFMVVSYLRMLPFINTFGDAFVSNTKYHYTGKSQPISFMLPRRSIREYSGILFDDNKVRGAFSYSVSGLGLHMVSSKDDNPDYCGPDGNRLRAEANSYGQERGKLMEAAKKAYEAGEKGKAKDLSEQGKAMGEKMNATHKKAAEAILKYRNDNYESNYLDLHGLRLDEAIEAFKERISQLQQKCLESNQELVFELIPGAGHHSAGKAVIKPKIIEELVSMKLPFVEKNAGTLIVTINSPQQQKLLSTIETNVVNSNSDFTTSSITSSPPSPVTSSPPAASLSASSPLIIVREKAAKIITNLRSLLTGNGWNGKFNFSKESLSKLGLSALLSYGFVSNISYVSCLIIAWISHGKAYKLSPLAPGQWKSFLVIYSGLWAANNVIRPLRFSLSLALSPAFDKFVEAVRNRTGWGVNYARALVIFLVNIVGTISYLVLGILFAATITGVPVLP